MNFAYLNFGAKVVNSVRNIIAMLQFLTDSYFELSFFKPIKAQTKMDLKFHYQKL